MLLYIILNSYVYYNTNKHPQGKFRTTDSVGHMQSKKKKTIMMKLILRFVAHI